MYQIQLSNPIHIHFTGIGGISMSGLAEILIEKGFFVSGSDIRESDITKTLISRGAQVCYHQDAAAIPADTDVLVYTAAIHSDHPELVEAGRRGIPTLTRAQLLGEIMRFYPFPVGISGTHGKTTTTSMLSEILMAAGVDPTLSIGGILPSIGGNIRLGGGDIFVTEACEYTDSFLSFYPLHAAILNVEEDHLDYFEDLADIIDSFHSYARLLPDEGTLVINRRANGYHDITKDLRCRVVSFSGGYEKGAVNNGTGNTHNIEEKDSKGDYHFTVTSTDAYGNPCITIASPGFDNCVLTLSVPGIHNCNNAVAALALADTLGIDRAHSLQALGRFTGTKRRFEHKGSFDGVTVIDDYAHHPTEISSCLAAARDCAKGDIWCVFQPHTYTRTKAFLDEFATALMSADHVILQTIYPARETDSLGVSSQSIADIMASKGKNVLCHESFEESKNFLKKSCNPGDMVITMGAGDIVKLGEMLVN